MIVHNCIYMYIYTVHACTCMSLEKKYCCRLMLRMTYYVYAQVHTYMYVYAHTYMCVHTCMCVCIMYVCVHACTCVYIHGCNGFCMQLLWSKDIHDRLTRDELAKSVPEAERLLELHQERKVQRKCYI